MADPAPPFRGNSQSCRVLIVDDEDVILDVLGTALEGEFQVACVHNAEEALPLLEAGTPEVVLLDKNLPTMPGLQLLKVIKERWPSTEVILITAYASLESAVEALRLGASDYLIKPFPHIQVVEEKVRWARDRRKLVAERTEFVNKLLRLNQELQRSMESLRQAEERYRLLFDACSDMVFVNAINPERELDRFREVNQAVCEALGYSRDELLTMGVLDVLAKREHVALPGMISLLESEKKVLFETEVIARDGRGIAVEVHSHLFELNGQPVVLSVARNISDHVLVEIERPGQP